MIEKTIQLEAFFSLTELLMTWGDKEAAAAVRLIRLSGGLPRLKPTRLGNIIIRTRKA